MIPGTKALAAAVFSGCSSVFLFLKYIINGTSEILPNAKNYVRLVNGGRVVIDIDENEKVKLTFEDAQTNPPIPSSTVA